MSSTRRFVLGELARPDAAVEHNVSGRDGVDANAFQRQRAGEAAHGGIERGLGRRIGHRRAEGGEAANRGNADDRPVAAAAPHDRAHRLDRIGGGKQIEIHDAVPFGGGFLAGRHRCAAANVADQDVDAAPPRFDVMRHPERRRRIGDVGDVE